MNIKRVFEVADDENVVENEKWRIQYDGHFWLNSRFFSVKLHKNTYGRGFEVADNGFEVEI